ncbi:MAG TPA: MBL fold metallo-hydrolase [Gammaproteobacteria bacterium]|nr:MBL fold metallo-hydrolase [Gammaproteobacteria bacterium]
MTNAPRRAALTRRAALKGGAAFATLGLLPDLLRAQTAAKPAAPKGTKLVMLGTRGGPGVDLKRSETASAVIVGGAPYLLDCGYGTVRALVESGIGFTNVDTLFLSHLHNDHMADLAALLSLQWTSNKARPTHVYGPYATASTVAGALQFMRADVEIRVIDEGRSVMPETVFFGHDLTVGADPVRVFADDRVVVTAVTNTHYPERAVARMPHRSLGYRFETAGRTIAFAGDTAYSANVVKLARGADVFVCEIMDHAVYLDNVARGKAATEAGNTENLWRHIAETHSPPADVGRMASEAKVKTVVLNHQLRGPAQPGGTAYAISAFIDGVREKFAGEVIVGEDQLVI